jgi:hypothetical protein
MASDDHVAAALKVFTTEVRRISRIELDEGGALSPAESDRRRLRLKELANEAEALAAEPRAATYQRFAQILSQVQELGASPAAEVIIDVASAFLQRPYVRPTPMNAAKARGEHLDPAHRFAERDGSRRV